MPELNPIVTTLLQLIEAKQQDAALAQRKQEADDQMAFNHEQLANTLEERKLERKRQEAIDAVHNNELRIAFEDQRKAGVNSGAIPMQGYKGAQPSIPDWQTQLGQGQTRTIQLPNGQSIEVPMPTMDTSVSLPAQSQIPYSTQEYQGPTGPVSIPTSEMSSYEDAQKRLEEQDRRKMGFDILKAGLTSQVQEAAKGPNLRATNQARIDAAQVTATGAGERSTAEITSREKIANSTNATRLAVANLGLSKSKNIDLEALRDKVESVAFGETDLSAGNQGIIQIHALKQLNRKPFGTKNMAKVVAFQEARDTLDRLNSEVIPLLSDTKPGAVLKGAIVGMGYPSDLKNKVEPYRLAAQQAARKGGIVGSMSDRDAQAAMDALTNPTTTKLQGLDRIRIAKEKVSKDIVNTFQGVPDTQVIEILTKPGLNFDINNVYAMDKTGKIVYDEKGPAPKYMQKDGTWGVFNPVTSKYKRIE